MKRLPPVRSTLGLAAVLLTACSFSSPRSSYVPSALAPSRSAKNIDSIALLAKGDRPSCDYQVVGKVVGQGGNFSFGDVVATKQLRQEIASRGLDGGLDYACAKPGSLEATMGECTASAYFCR
jgi:hypothetical protein